MDSLRGVQIRAYADKALQATFKPSNGDLALLYADSMYQLAQKGADRELILSSEALRWQLYGDTYRRQGKKEAAYKAYRACIGVIDRVVFEKEKEYLGHCYIGLGYLFEQDQLYDSIYLYTDKAFALPTNNRSFFRAKRTFVALLARHEEFSKAIKYAQTLATDTRDIDDPYYEYVRLATMGSMYNQLGNYEQLMAYNDSCLQIAQALNDSLLLMNTYNALGVAQIFQEDYPSALEWFKKALEIGRELYGRSPYYKFKRPSDPSVTYQRVMLDVMYRDVGATFIRLGQPDSAQSYLEEALKIAYQHNNYNDIVSVLGYWADACRMQKGNYDQALDSLNKAYDWCTKVGYANYNRHLLWQKMGQVYAAKNQVDSALVYYNRTIEFSKQEENFKLLVDVYKLLRNLYADQGDYAKAYEYQNAYLEAYKKLRNQTYEQKVASMEVKYELGLLRATNDMLEENNRLQETQLEFSARLNQRNQFLIVTLIGGFALLLILGLVLYRQRGLNEQVARMRLEQKALKAQINPHFFFNVLNSLQGTILSKTPMEAYQHHSKFTQLMRLVLTQSEEETLPLKDELKALQLYIELEQLRTGHAFEFIIDVDLDSDQMVRVPSMLLQPFVENAIWHGVMNRDADEEKRIDIRIRPQGTHILCEIEDTGVGRAAAAQIKAQKTQQHKSMGIQVTKDRLELFRLRHKLPLTFKIEDRYHSNGQVSGTKVSLEIPILSV